MMGPQERVNQVADLVRAGLISRQVAARLLEVPPIIYQSAWDAFARPAQSPWTLPLTDPAEEKRACERATAAAAAKVQGTQGGGVMCPCGHQISEHAFSIGRCDRCACTRTMEAARAAAAAAKVQSALQPNVGRHNGVTQGDLNAQAARADPFRPPRAPERLAPLATCLVFGEASSAAAHERETRAPYLRPGLPYDDGGDW